MGGFCFGAMGLMLPSLPAAERGEIDRLDQEMLTKAGLSFQTILIALSIMIFLPGVSMLVLGIFVRRGGLGAAVGAMVVTVLSGLFALFSMVMGLIGSAQGDAQSIPGTVVMGIGVLVMGTLLAYLIQTVRAAPAVAASRRYLQQQYWQYQQSAMQHYAGAAGYSGYAMPPAPQPAPPLPNTQPPMPMSPAPAPPNTTSDDDNQPPPT